MQPDLDELKAIVNSIYGDDLNIDVFIEGATIYLETEKDEDKALVIGRSGRNINSLRELVRVYNKLHSTDYNLELKEDPVDGGEPVETEEAEEAV